MRWAAALTGTDEPDRARTRRARVVLALIALLSLLPASVLAARPYQARLTILHVNDTHGQLRPTLTIRGLSGGAARLAAEVNRVRRDDPGRVLFLHAGDLFSKGQPAVVLTRGRVNTEVMNLMGYDAWTPGNGEFYFGARNLKRCIALARFDVLTSNVFEKRSGRTIGRASVIREVQGVRVGLLGLCLVRQGRPSADPLRVDSRTLTAKRIVPALRSQSDVVIALTHQGVKQDMQMAGRVPGIDVIVGGHSHTALKEPIRVTTPGGGETLVVQAGDYFRYLGRLDLELRLGADDRYRIASATGRLIPLAASGPRDAKVDAALAAYAERLDRVVWTSPKRYEHPSGGASPAAQHVAERLREAMGVQVFVLDRSAVVAPIPKGKVTLRHVCRLHPWRNTIWRVRLSGLGLRRMLKHEKMVAAGAEYVKRPGEEGFRVGRSLLSDEAMYDVAFGEYVIHYLGWLRQLHLTDTGFDVTELLTQEAHSAPRPRP